ncbi:SCAN domain-containing protein 3-like [Oopsacas minuta]|uniref:SCAN domain-containing protein 3-like n=1 Tax=Oopsacas minuta TaxID=111878 RepID=A0AAV7KBQ1_9METZ|nr:SCAN domain-containing protein 3-like [Oopsacas minuta]
MFPNLSEIINCESGLDATSLANIITEHLKSLAERFEFYFPKEQDPREGNGWICNPFLQLKDELNVHLEDKLLDLAGDQGLKNIFYSEITLAEFWIKVRPEYPELSELALKRILPFPSTYLCEMGFSTMSIIKTKYRNSLDVRSPLRVALSSIEPRLDKLVKSKQAHSSH